VSGGDAPLRVLVANWLDRENPRSGGAETHLHETFGRLAARGHEIVALTSGWRGAPPRALLDGIEVHRAGRRYTFSLAAPALYRRSLRARGFDVFVEDLNKVPLFSPAWAGVPVVLLAHHLFGGTAFQAGPWPLAAATWLLERPIPRVFRDTPVIAVSESTREDLVRRGLRPEAIEVVPNGIDAERYRPPPGTERFAEPTLAFVGRLKRYKRVDLVLRAMGRLVAGGREVRLLVAGTGEERDALERLAGRLGLAPRVRFLGFVPEDEKVSLLRRAWIHVLCSEKEGWGITNMEAAACGTPTVASDVPGLRDSVVHGETGLLVPHGNVPALAEALGRLLGDAALRARMAGACLAHAGRHSWERAADDVERVLRRVAGKGRR